MTLYEKIKNMSIDEMAESLICLSIGSAFAFIFKFEPDKDFIKSLPNYNEFYNKTKQTLQEANDEKNTNKV